MMIPTTAGRSTKALAVLLLIFVTPTFAVFADDGESQYVSAIQKAREASNEALRIRDVESVVRQLEADAHLTVSSSALVSGRAAQADAYRAQFERFPDVVYQRRPTEIEIGENQTASERGIWIGTWTSPSGSVEQSGVYMAMWRKQESGEWKIRSEIFVALACAGSGCRR